MLRYARYAAAVLFALLAMGFVALWMRSRDTADLLICPVRGQHSIGLSSDEGVICAGVSHAHPPDQTEWWAINYTDGDEDGGGFRWKRGVIGAFGFEIANYAQVSAISLPHWFLALSSFAVAGLLAFKPITRFTVRGLLITTTLLAAMLGLAVYAV
jgi:hypothetical protein